MDRQVVGQTGEVEVLVSAQEELAVDVEVGQLAGGVARDVLVVVNLHAASISIFTIYSKLFKIGSRKLCLHLQFVFTFSSQIFLSTLLEDRTVMRLASCYPGKDKIF